MIKSELLSIFPCIIKHTLSGNISEVEAQHGVDRIVELMFNTVRKDQKSALLINVSNYSFKTLEARRIWSLQFKMNTTIQQITDFVGIVGSKDSPIGKEQVWMETTRVKFFELELEAETWLMQMKSEN